MTDDELKQLGDLMKKYERGKDKAAVVKIISDSAHEAFQDIHDTGHSAATAAKNADIKSLEAQVLEFKTKFETADGKLKAFDEKAPDVAKVRETYEAAERKLREEHQQAMQNLTQKQQDELKAKDQALLQLQLKQATSALVKKLAVGENGVVEDYAETILMNKNEVKSRLVPQPDGSVKVLKKGSTDLFIVPTDDQTALDIFAAELAEGVDDRWKGSGVGRGSGSKGSEGGSGAPLVEKFDNTRKRVTTKATEAAKATKEAGSGLERLGSRR